MDIVKVLIGFILTFLVIYALYYAIVIKKTKKNRKMVSTEVSLILYYYDIDVDNIDTYQMVKVVSVVTSLILTTIITVISMFFDSKIILLIFGTLISLVVAFICYNFIGKYYEKKSKRNDESSKKSK